METKEQWYRCEQCPRRRCEHLGANSFPPMCKPSTCNPIWEALETTPPPELSDEEKERLAKLLRDAYGGTMVAWESTGVVARDGYLREVKAIYRDFYAKYHQRTDSRRLSDALAKLPSEYYISLYRSGSGELIDDNTIDGDAVENATEWGPTDNSVTAIEKAIEECKPEPEPEPTEEEDAELLKHWGAAAVSDLQKGMPPETNDRVIAASQRLEAREVKA